MNAELERLLLPNDEGLKLLRPDDGIGRPDDVFEVDIPVGTMVDPEA